MVKRKETRKACDITSKLLNIKNLTVHNKFWSFRSSGIMKIINCHTIGIRYK